MSLGLKANADGSGAIQVGGTDAINLSTGLNATFVQNANLPNTFGFKNRIINGAMVIDQRNAGASVANTGLKIYSLDRWFIQGISSTKFTAQQNAGAVTPPAGFINYLGITSSAATSLAAGDYYFFGQSIEGLNVADLGWGTANAQTITLSFWARSSLTGTFGGALRNSAGNRSYPFTFTISAANTWEQKTVTIAGDTSGTWLTTNGVGFDLDFSLGAGATFSGTAGAWAAGNYVSATGATSVVGTNGATFYVTGVQLEKGSTATSFDYRPYGTELSLCYRYCVQWNGTGLPYLTGQVNSATACYAAIPYAMRATPTAAFLSINVNDAAVANALSSITGLSMSGSGGGFGPNSSGLTAGRCMMLYGAGASSYLRFDAEL